jgi:predicted nuclease of predicted toxin-antitoxin system
MNPEIVADESVDFRIVTKLREASFVVFSIAESKSSITDQEVLTIAVSKNALLITEDKDFGELVFRFQLKHRGILLLRLTEKPKNIDTTVRIIVERYTDMQNNFSVLDENKLRIKQ